MKTEEKTEAGLLAETIRKIAPLSGEARQKARARLERLTMPAWALGRLMDLAEELCAVTGQCPPPVARKTIVTMAGDHGVAVEGVSKYPAEVTRQMVANFVNGGAGVNALAGLAGAGVVVVDMGVNAAPGALDEKVMDKKIGMGTANIAEGPAMTREDAVRCVEAGIGVALDLADSTDVFAAGEMGIANTTPSSAIVAAVTGAPPAEVTGRGTGLDDSQLERKIAVVERALAVNRPDADDGIDILAKVGGFEIGGIAGLILGAASLRKPVLVDGFISTAGALIARTIAPRSAEYMIASSKSEEPGHRTALAALGKTPLLDLGMRLGEGSAAALAMPLVDGAVRVLTKVATFEAAAVSRADK